MSDARKFFLGLVAGMLFTGLAVVGVYNSHSESLSTSPPYTNAQAVSAATAAGMMTGMSGDCTASGPGVAPITCTKTAGSSFAPIATSGNAGDLSAGTVIAARMPALSGDCTSSIGAVATTCTKTNGVSFASVATSGSASDLTVGTLPAAQLPALTGGCTSSAGSNVLTCAAPAIATPASRSLSLATAYQCTNTAKPCFVSVTISSTVTFSLSGTTTNTAALLVGSTNGVATGTGSVVGNYVNSIGGTIVIGLTLNNQATQSYTLAVPAGYFFAIRQTSGTVSIVSAFDQAIG